MEFDATFWALVALIIFLGFMVYVKVPGMLGKSLDNRAGKISSELDRFTTMYITLNSGSQQEPKYLD